MTSSLVNEGEEVKAGESARDRDWPDPTDLGLPSVTLAVALPRAARP